MKNILIMLFCLFAVIACNSCAPQPPPAPPPNPVIDAGPAPAPIPAPTVTVDAAPPPPPAPSTPVGLACANLRALGCPAGANGCEPALQHVVDSSLTTVNLACLTLAKSKDAARACKPAVACP